MTTWGCQITLIDTYTRSVLLCKSGTVGGSYVSGCYVSVTNEQHSQKALVLNNIF